MTTTEPNHLHPDMTRHAGYYPCSTCPDTVNTITAAPAWNAYLAALKSLEAANASYETYVRIDAGPDATDREVRRLGALTTMAHDTLTNARRAAQMASQAYSIAVELENEQ